MKFATKLPCLILSPAPKPSASIWLPHAHGFTLLCVGWQFDVPEQPDLMQAYVSVATNDGEPIEGLVRSDSVVRQPAFDRLIPHTRSIVWRNGASRRPRAGSARWLVGSFKARTE